MNCRPQSVAIVGAHFCSLYNNQQERKNFLSVITDAEWGIKLGKFGVGSFVLSLINEIIIQIGF